MPWLRSVFCWTGLRGLVGHDHGCDGHPTDDTPNTPARANAYVCHKATTRTTLILLPRPLKLSA